MIEQENILFRFGKVGNGYGFLSEPWPERPRPPRYLNELMVLDRNFNHDTALRAAYPDIVEYHQYLHYQSVIRTYVGKAPTSSSLP